MEDKQNILPFQIILHAGNSRSLSMEAKDLAKQGKYQEANEKFVEAQQELRIAHQIQTDLLFQECQDDSEIAIKVDLLLVHAQDHITMASMSLDFCQEFASLYALLDK